MLILEGIPLFLIELGIGQKMRLGSLGVWNTIHPWLGGIGISSCIVTLFVALYYNVIITWCFFYLFNSFRVSNTMAIVFFPSFKHTMYFSSSNYHGPSVPCSTKQWSSQSANRPLHTFGIVLHWIRHRPWTNRAVLSGGSFCVYSCHGPLFSSLL